ncbi:hypothetical protein MRS44_018113 [Fusarium solani]|uniref:uncharacterized protein n=1 Tax=Fusarium solani TaxID=169388 RepID=UPI0032C41228|nr:hypothetical protein MRS44_018113 [Fusarium solani]
MSNKPEPSIWDPYIQDVISLYCTQNRTAEETIQYLRDTYGFNPNLSQFKYKFGGKKKITEKEWTTGIIPVVRKRALEGKESDVHLYGNKLDLKRLKRGIGLYSARVSRDFMEADASAVIGQNLSDRLCITTPPCHSPLPPLSNPHPGVDQDVAEVVFPEAPTRIPRCASRGSIVLLSPSRGSRFLPHDGSYLDFNFDEYPPFQFGTPTAPSECIPDTDMQGAANPQTPQHSTNNVFPLTNADALLQLPFEVTPVLGDMQVSLVEDLPYFQLKGLVMQHNVAAYSPRMVDLLRPGLPLNAPLTDGSFDTPTTTGQPSNGLQSMLAKVMGIPYNGQCTDIIPALVTKLQALVPEWYPGELNVQAQTLFDPSQKPPIFQIFEVAAYFCSNNMLGEEQVAIFVKWVIEHNHVKSLTLFLRERWGMFTVQAFVFRLLEAGSHAQNKDFLRQLHAIGAKFGGVAEQLMKINDPEFLDFVLSTLGPELLEGESGGRLLRIIARTPHIALAERLIEAGAEVNIGLSEEVWSSPLWEAIDCANFEMVKVLVRAGADVNKHCHGPLAGFATAPLPLAVWKKDARVVEYLLDQNAAIRGSVNNKPLLQYAAEHVPHVYELLLKQSRSASWVTVGQLLKAADSDTRVLSEFLSQHLQVSQQMLEEALVEALAEQKTKAVVNLLQHRVDPDGPLLPGTRWRPLYTAATTPHPESVRQQYTDLLIYAKADVNIDGLLEALMCPEDFSCHIIDKLIGAGLDLSRYGPAAIEESMGAVDTEPIIFLLERGVSVNSYGRRATPFQAAALMQDLEFLQYLFRRGADVNKPPFPIRGCTALQAAANARSMEKIQFLLGVGADIHAAPAVIGGVTALEATVRPSALLFDDYDEDYYEESGHTETFVFLLDKGAAVNRPDGSSSPLLHDIIERRSTHLLLLALGAGAHTNHQWGTLSSSGCERTPLQLAAEMGQVEALKLLLDHGADPNASPAFHHGRTALQAAASSETASLETVKLLLTANAAVNADPAAVGGITALQGAAIKGHFQIALFLIEGGADVNAPAAIKDGRTAIEGAAEHGRLDMVQMLLNAGATGDAIRKTGFMKAISLAREHRHFAVADLLESHAIA